MGRKVRKMVALGLLAVISVGMTGCNTKKGGEIQNIRSKTALRQIDVKNKLTEIADTDKVGISFNFGMKIDDRFKDGSFLTEDYRSENIKEMYDVLGQENIDVILSLLENVNFTLGVDKKSQMLVIQNKADVKIKGNTIPLVIKSYYKGGKLCIDIRDLKDVIDTKNVKDFVWGIGEKVKNNKLEEFSDDKRILDRIEGSYTELEKTLVNLLRTTDYILVDLKPDTIADIEKVFEDAVELERIITDYTSIDSENYEGKFKEMQSQLGDYLKLGVNKANIDVPIIKLIEIQMEIANSYTLENIISQGNMSDEEKARYEENYNSQTTSTLEILEGIIGESKITAKGEVKTNSIESDFEAILKFNPEKLNEGLGIKAISETGGDYRVNINYGLSINKVKDFNMQDISNIKNVKTLDEINTLLTGDTVYYIIKNSVEDSLSGTNYTMVKSRNGEVIRLKLTEGSNGNLYMSQYSINLFGELKRDENYTPTQLIVGGEAYNLRKSEMLINNPYNALYDINQFKEMGLNIVVE